MGLPPRGLGLPPVIETERLVLRPLEPEDAPALARGAGDFEVARRLATVPHPYAVEDALAFVEARPGEGRVWGIVEKGALKGIVSIRDELGYWIARPHWGRGIATEASRAAARAWFAAGPAMLTASHMDDNEASRRVLLKLGFEDAGPKPIPSRALGREVPGRLMRLGRAP